MKKIFAFVAVFAFLTLPLVSFAWAPGEPIVPKEVINLVTGANSTPQDVQACHLVLLADNLVSFAVFFSTIVAAVMFAYAGILYVTASARAENLNQAKGIFGKVFLGFVFILGAWLMIDILLSVLTKEKQGFVFWSDIQCETRAERAVPLGGIETVSESGDERRETENRALLDTLNVDVNSGRCAEGQTEGCTDTAGLSARTIGYAGDTKSDCDAALGRECGIVITGGSEGGHAGGANPGSHGGGDKIDLRANDDTKDYVKKQVEAGVFTEVENPKFGEKQYVDTRTGAVWTFESKTIVGRTIEHYDVCTSNCSAPAAQGS